jgi:hypothetical protein
MRRREIRTERYGAAMGGAGLVEPAGLAQRVAEIAVPLREARRRGERLADQPDGLGRLAARQRDQP